VSTPCVSVCIVTFNHEQYIHDCVMSVVMQAQDVQLEVLIGDDGSTDRTGVIAMELAKRFPECIRYFSHKEKLGAAGNYQFLIRTARGRFIAHLDGDDYWLPGKLKAQIDLIGGSSSVAAVYTNALCVDTCGALIGIFNNRQPERFGLDYLLSRGNFLNHSSVLYRATVGQDILAWPADYLDYKLHLFLAGRGDIGYLNRPGVAYRINTATSMVLSQSNHVRMRYWESIREIDESRASDAVRISAAADFLRRVTFTAVRSGSLGIIKFWIPLVFREFQRHRARLTIYVVFRLAVGVWWFLRNRLASMIGGHSVPVYFWR
jgi:glycosyltransferase involved in cell wall biosynthesis